MTKELGLKLMVQYIECAASLKDGKEPYPTSLRILNWTKFVCVNTIQDESIDDFIHEDAHRLMDNLEYHLLANHLLENGFALLFAGVYLQQEKLFNKGRDILLDQLEEQILPDGAHFELSPMYHQLMLFRVLDAIQLLKASSLESPVGELLRSLETKGSMMLGWLNSVSFKNGTIPLVNDSARGINPTTSELNFYATELGIEGVKLILNESGYRKFSGSQFEMLIDVGDIKPRYQPGHSHADTFSYILNLEGKPYIVEAGTATYDFNERRSYERGTSAHNTVSVNNSNSSNVWSSFRVAQRAHVYNFNEESNSISATHDGFGNIKHSRRWEVEEGRILIQDKLNKKVENAISYIHLHPNVEIIECLENRVVTTFGKIELSGHNRLELDAYGYAEEFNKVQEAKVLKIHFSASVQTTIYFN